MERRVKCRKVFVVGCPRSGTSWVLEILRKHPIVLTSGESHLYPELFEPIVRDGLDEAVRDRLLARYDVRPLGEWSGLHQWVERDELARLLDAAAESGLSRADAAENVISGVLESFVARRAGTESTILVEKTPRHLRVADRILRRFPEAVIVEVLRDGRDVCVSLQLRGTVASWPPKERAVQIGWWVDAVRLGRALLATPEAAGRWHVFRFEEAKADPYRVIADLFTFCGLPFDHSLTTRVAQETEFSRLTGTGPGLHYGSGEVGNWQRHFDEADRALFQELAGETLVAAGYRR